MKSHGEVKFINGKRIATPEYRSWQMMKNRCLNPKNKNFNLYGERGITISDAWNTYENFLADMGRRPAPSYSLERIDNNKGYFKDNCKWASKKEQARNRSYCNLDMDAAREIRKLYATGKYFQKDLAKIFNSTQAGISQIIRGAAWKE